MSINKEAFAKFADALDSGQYQQSYGVLCDQQGYCVWGVATEIVYEQLGFVRNDLFDYVEYVKEEGLYGFPERGSFTPPPSVLVHYFGEYKDDNDVFGKLLDMNDNKTHTFPEMAQWIRENILKED